MEIIKTPIEDLIIIKPRVFEDARGFFFESYSELKFNKSISKKRHYRCKTLQNLRNHPKSTRLP